MKQLLLIISIGLASTALYGQRRVNAGGFFPEAQLSVKASDKWKLVGKIESQHGTVFHDREQDADWSYYHDRTDFQAFADYKLGPLAAVAVGYQYRWNGNAPNNHRAIQQISFIQVKRRMRMGHRVRTDQTFEPLEKPEFRLRYRLVLEIPLQGIKIDPGEYYLIASNEPIFGTQGGDFNIENRVVCSLGHYFSKKHKLEGGLDYRADSFLDGGLRQRFWFKVGWFVNI